ncbi:hypothetical protein [Streptomyces sp. MST-110588]|uniref:DUF7848 domain-containing protein n=1 Tax=Streptomyces sp. MST-110588 TaxID=2833628 RepID=UPI001F5D7CB0|nr:hypothetical protein [Streptomyces sp. MST-110588]UNO39290.1 hypothetical protein KGS77_06220 [Streptomyces sp. MST-110588]
MATPAPSRDRRVIEINGVRKHFAECTTETDGNVCGARSSLWDNPLRPNAWMRAHADETGHGTYDRCWSEPVTVPAKNTTDGRRQSAPT